MKRLKLASVGAVPRAAAARQPAREALGQVAIGADPFADCSAAEMGERPRLDDLLNRYDQDLERRGYVNRKTVISGLRSKMSGLLQRDVREMTGADLVSRASRADISSCLTMRASSPSRP